MMIVDPKIIIFDEATSNLDSESEKLIQEAFWKVSKGKTVIIIAHRLSTVKRADKIVVLEKGRIVQKGTHRQLRNKPGLYQHLWELQSEKEEEILLS
jgi:ABC-type multidrug transport system fused ATPase/permease subunit